MYPGLKDAGMAEHSCLNCGAREAEAYDLTVRSNAHEGVYLCDECHEAIQQEMSDAS